MNIVAILKNKSHNTLKTQGGVKHGAILTKKEDFDCGCDEVTPQYAKKLERISKEAEEGKGKKFENMRELKKYLATL